MLNSKEVKIFGDTHLFAIRYVACPGNSKHDQKFAICHLVINNVILGDITEECYLPTWFFQITNHRDFIKKHKDNLYPNAFSGLSDREIIALVKKSNQLADDFDKNFLYLPQLTSELWQRHLFQLDETIDAFTICYYVAGNSVKFIIEQNWPKREDIGQTSVTYASIELNYFLSVLDDLIDFLERTYPYLSRHKA
jgi:hypothetical protein